MCFPYPIPVFSVPTLSHNNQEMISYFPGNSTRLSGDTLQGTTNMIAQPRLRSRPRPACNVPEVKRKKLDPEQNTLTPEPSRLGKRVYEIMKGEKSSSFTDINLVCPDGTRIPAVRMILAMGSAFFETRLTSNFSQKRCFEVSINVESKELREILEFIYIDDCPLIRKIRSGYNDSAVGNTARDLMNLAFAAEYTCTDRLLSRCKQAINSLYEAHRHIAIYVIQVMRQHKFIWCQDLCQNAFRSCNAYTLETLYHRCRNCSIACSVRQLDNNTAEEVFSKVLENKVRDTHADIFVILLLWASGGTIKEQIYKDWRRYSGHLNVSRFTKMKFLGTRLETARKIAKWLDLSESKRSFLSKVVEVSGLLDKSAISEVYKKISLRYERSVFRSDP